MKRLKKGDVGSCPMCWNCFGGITFLTYMCISTVIRNTVKFTYHGLLLVFILDCPDFHVQTHPDNWCWAVNLCNVVGRTWFCCTTCVLRGPLLQLKVDLNDRWSSIIGGLQLYVALAANYYRWCCALTIKGVLNHRFHCKHQITGMHHDKSNLQIQCS